MIYEDYIENKIIFDNFYEYGVSPHFKYFSKCKIIAYSLWLLTIIIAAGTITYANTKNNLFYLYNNNLSYIIFFALTTLPFTGGYLISFLYNKSIRSKILPELIKFFKKTITISWSEDVSKNQINDISDNIKKSNLFDNFNLVSPRGNFFTGINEQLKYKILEAKLVFEIDIKNSAKRDSGLIFVFDINKNFKGSTIAQDLSAFRKFMKDNFEIEKPYHRNMHYKGKFRVTSSDVEEATKLKPIIEELEDVCKKYKQKTKIEFFDNKVIFFIAHKFFAYRSFFSTSCFFSSFKSKKNYMGMYKDFCMLIDIINVISKIEQINQN